MPSLVTEGVEYTSVSGSKLALEKGIQYPPAILLNGKLTARGKVDAESMIKIILK